MRKNLLDKNKNFYKGNMHCHSNLSDGYYSPEELKALYKEMGYSFLAITDHEFLNINSQLDDEDFITLTSGEFAIKEFPEQSTLKNFNMKVCHLNFYAKKPDNDYIFCYNSVFDHYSTPELKASFNRPEGEYERVYGHEGIRKLIREANERGFFVSYNHPRWSLENYADYCGYDGIWAVEIYNTACNVDGLYDYDINVFDDMLRDGKRVFATCGDDNHNKSEETRHLHSGRSFVMVNTDSLSYENIVEGLLSGNFYSSQGPVINELYVEDGKVYVSTSDAKQISYSTKGRRTKAVVAEEGSVNEAVFEIKDTDEYFRIDVIDENGYHANTQAYFLSEL